MAAAKGEAAAMPPLASRVLRCLSVCDVIRTLCFPHREATRSLRRSPLDLPDSGPAAADAVRDACREAFAASLKGAERQERPYRHWLLADMLPADVGQGLDALPFEAPDLHGVSGSREVHNNTRRYLDSAAIETYPICRGVAEAFQDPRTVALVQDLTGADVEGCCLRIEYAQDTDGFWLQPHTDLGVKKFTLLYYLSPGAEVELATDLGTDIYADAETWSHRAPFRPGAALAFVPSTNTWHGFEARPIPVVRKSLIVNYVTAEWRAREQLAYPETPVTAHP
jgi:hypothetical protein